MYTLFEKISTLNVYNFVHFLKMYTLNAHNCVHTMKKKCVRSIYRIMYILLKKNVFIECTNWCLFFEKLCLISTNCTQFCTFLPIVESWLLTWGLDEFLLDSKGLFGFYGCLVGGKGRMKNWWDLGIFFLGL